MRDAMCHSESCQLLNNQLVRQVQKKNRRNGVRALQSTNKLVHLATTRSTVVGVTHKLTVESTSLLITPIHRRLAVAKFSKAEMQKLLG